jgi:ribosome maturation factor RimP
MLLLVREWVQTHSFIVLLICEIHLEDVLNKKEIESTVEKIVMDIIDSLDASSEKIEVIDVEYVKERDFYLRIFLDKKSGIGMDDCRLISGCLEKKLDQLDLIQDRYYLEVSSPGLDRQLKKEKDFARHTGEMVEIKLYQPIDGTKNFIGALIGLQDGVIRLKDIKESDASAQKGKKQKQHPPKKTLPQELNIPFNDAASVRLYVDF